MKHSEEFVRLANEARQRIKEVAPHEVSRLVAEGAVVIDVRDKEELASGQVDGAVHISRGTLEMRVSEVIPDKNTPIVCYCMGGYRGALAADTLQRLGYKNAMSLAGGLRAYLAHQNP